MSETHDVILASRDREKCLSMALLRLLGATQVEAPNAASVNPRTVGRWESCSWWPEVLAEASQRWLQGLEAKARWTLEEGMDAALALKILERGIPELAPPGIRADLIHRRERLPISVRIRFVSPEGEEDPTNRVPWPSEAVQPGRGRG